MTVSRAHKIADWGPSAGTDISLIGSPVAARPTPSRSANHQETT